MYCAHRSSVSIVAVWSHFSAISKHFSGVFFFFPIHKYLYTKRWCRGCLPPFPLSRKRDICCNELFFRRQVWCLLVGRLPLKNEQFLSKGIIIMKKAVIIKTTYKWSVITRVLTSPQRETKVRGVHSNSDYITNPY